MESYEAISHSFVIRLWLEEAAEGNKQATWRASITHVPSGRRQYLKNIDELNTFILLYLEEMGVDPGLCYRIRRRLAQIANLKTIK